MGTFVVLVVLISVVALIVRGIVRDKKEWKNLPAVGTVHIAEAAIRYSDQHKFQVIKKGMV